MLAVAAMLAHGTPPPVTEPAPVELVPSARDDLREELAALRHELEEERVQRQLILDELRRNRPSPVVAPVAVAEEPTSVDRGQEVDDLVAFGQDVIVDGVVRGTATSFGGNVIVRPNGEVFGDAVSFGGTVVIEPGGTVHGDRIGMERRAVQTEDDDSEEGWLSFLYHRAMLVLSLAGAGTLVVGLFPQRVEGVSRQIDSGPVGSGIVGAGFGVLMCVFCVLFMLLTFGLGTPVSAVGMGVLGAAWLLGFVALCQTVGDRLPLEQPHGRWAALVGGSLLFAFAGSIGTSGLWLTFLLSMVGVGAAVLSRFGANSN